MERNIYLNAGGQAVFSTEATEYRLEPGLLHVLLAAGCWRGDQMSGAGEVTLLVRRPGQTELQPAAAEELIVPARK